MSDASKEFIVPRQGDHASLEERKFELEVRKFEFEKSKSQGLLGFFNSNLGIIITLIVGVATVAVSSNQVKINEQSNIDQRELQARINTDQLNLQREISANQLKLQSETSEAQRNLETLRARTAQEKETRTFQFEIARAMLEKQGEISTQELKRVYYLREVVMSVLPKEAGLVFTRSAAENAGDDRVRSAWLDGFVKLSLNEGLDLPPSGTRSISVDNVLTNFPALTKFADARKRIQDILDAAKESKLERSAPIILAYALSTSDFFKGIEEDFNFASAEQIAAAFPSSFPNPSDARLFVGDRRALANKLYSGRFGNDKPDDGWNFRGRGYLRTTGKAAYARSNDLIRSRIERRADLTKINLVAEPGRLAESGVAAAEIVAAFAQLADLGLPITVDSAVQLLNGRLLGLARIQAIYEKLAPGTPKVTEGLPIPPIGRSCSPWC